MKLTVGNTPALELPPGKADHVFWDDEIPGFGVRLLTELALYPEGKPYRDEVVLLAHARLLP